MAIAAIPLKLREIEGKTTLACQNALHLAEEHEAGQAETPLVDAFRQLCNPSPTEPLRVALVGLDPASTAEALAALVGHDCNVCRVVLTGSIGLTEIVLQERGFGVELGEKFEEFDTLEPFLAALQRAGESAETRGARHARNWLDPVRYKLPSSAVRSGLNVLIPDAISSLVTRPALLSALAERADWLFITGALAATPDARNLEILQVLATQLLGVQVLVSVPEPGANTLPAVGWWSGISHRIAFAPLALGSPAAEARLTHFTDPQGPLRLITLESRRRRSVQNMLRVQVEEISQGLQTLKSRRRLYESESQAGKPSVANSASRRAQEALRTRLQDDLDATLGAIVEGGKRALLGDSPLMKKVRELAASLDPKDLERTVGEEKVKLTLAQEREDQLCLALRELGKAHLMEDLDLVHQSIGASVAAIEKEISQASGVTRKFTIDYPDSRALWESILSLARPEVRYRGEMPRMTFTARLGAARQSVMALLMATTLLGGSLALFGVPNLRNILMMASIPLFLAAFAWTFLSFRKQERLGLAREIDKLRDGLVQELRRVMSDLFREEQNRLTQFFSRTSRELNTQLAEFFRLSDEAEAQEREKNRKQSADLNKNLEGSLKTLERRQQESQRLLGTLGEPERATLALLEETLKLLSPASSAKA